MRKSIFFLLVFLVTLLCVFFLSSQVSAQKNHSKPKGKSSAKSSVHKKPKAKKILYGLASYYHNKFHGRRTASGQIFNQHKLTAACNVLPIGTMVKVTNLKNGKTVIVKVNDRLNVKTRRLIDLTYQAASKLGFIKKGLTRVKLEVLH